MLLEIDGTAIILAISFIVFAFIMQKVFYSPITAVRKERTNYIRNNNDAAGLSETEAQNTLIEHESTIMQAKKNAAETVSASTGKANERKTTILAIAHKKAKDRFEASKEELYAEKKTAKAQLKSEILTLAHAISSKVLGKDVPISGVNSQIIDDILDG
jgi:F-type H+-transporting ATPase subunit b